MPNITNCPRCGRLYEASPEETAYESDRRCPACWRMEVERRERRERDRPPADLWAVADDREDPGF
jgi:hypothetical protein